METKNIVILGGGFGGFRAALDLEKKLRRDPRYRIILLDQNTFHLYTASLYEVATGELSQRCVLLPFHHCLSGKKIEFINATVTELDPIKKIVKTNSGDRIPYWKLVFAFGADTEDFGIPGVAEYGLGVKSVADAERIRQHLAHCAVTKGRPIKVVVGGGGFTGIEIAGELTGYRGCPIEITVIEAAPRVLAGLPEIVSKTVAKRLNLLGVKVVVSSPIQEVKPDQIILATGREISYDVLIWTAGVRGSRFLDPNTFPLDKKKALVVDNYLRVKSFEDIFVAGDNAATGVAWTAVKAEADGKIAAHNIIAQVRRKKMKAYKKFEPPFIIPVGKGWAIAKIGTLIFWGKAASILKDFVLLYYLVTILPIWKALKVWWGGECEVLEIKRPVS
uniref:FAD/NAD(P)-binding domain-containing protein n=1 Tax=candidate division WWE3 bacterium TaxID=2053526 RepID=A0A831Z0E5_UNCKA